MFNDDELAETLDIFSQNTNKNNKNLNNTNKINLKTNKRTSIKTINTKKNNFNTNFNKKKSSHNVDIIPHDSPSPHLSISSLQPRRTSRNVKKINYNDENNNNNDEDEEDNNDMNIDY